MGFDRFGSFGHSRSFASSFFTNEAIRAGYISSSLAESHLMDRRLSSREALRWEIEDRIRVEMIADITRRRQLEEEVRRELALEREMVLRRELRLLESLAPVSSDVEADNRFSVGGKPLSKSSFAFDWLRPEAGYSSEPALAEPRAAVEKQVKTSSETLRGAKRKVPAPPSPVKAANAQEMKLPWLAIPRKKTKLSQSVWTCKLCKISCTSRDSLDDHQLGKKHNAKLEELRLRKEEGPSDKMDQKMPQPTATKAAGVTSEGPVAGAAEKTLKKEPGNKKQLKGKTVESNAQEMKLPWLAIPRKKTKLTQSVWTCKLCKISCTSRDSLADHQLGKKHNAKLEELRLRKEEGPSDKMGQKMPQPTATKAAGVTSGGPVAGAVEKNLKKEPGNKKQLKGKTVEPSPEKQNVEKKSSGFMFWCGHCGVGCNSEVVHDSHLKGKKHTAKLEELKISGDASDRDMPACGRKFSKRNQQIRSSDGYAGGGWLCQ